MMRVGTTALVLGALLAAGARAADHGWFEARVGLAAARACARAWAEDAALVYVENDGLVDPTGAAPRWGYLFYSSALDKARAYSIRDGKVVVAENLEMKFEAPPLAAEWIDSGKALEAAEQEVGHAFRLAHGGQLKTMLLVRGALESGDPDLTTWMLVYTAPHIPSLFVVVDAASGTVRRTWSG